MDGKQEPERIDTVVIGAGQAGPVGRLPPRQAGLPFVILDADARIGDHWREHWDSLRLYSPARSDGLPGMRFPASSYHYPSGREMGDYLEAYASRFDLPVRSGTRVDGVRPTDAARRRLRRRRPATGDLRRRRSSSRPARSASRTSPASPPSSIRRSGSSTRATTATRHSYREGPVLVVGRQPLGCRHRLRSRPHASHVPGRSRPRRASDPGHRHVAGPARLAALGPRGQPRADDANADRPADGARSCGWVADRCCGSAARTWPGSVWSATTRVVGVLDGKPALADGTGTRRRERRSGARASGPTTAGSLCRTSSVKTAGRTGRAASLKQRPGCISWASRSRMASRRCWSPVPVAMPGTSSTGSRGGVARTASARRMAPASAAR